jgi:ABC-type transport system involved in multi-copper enzyme maturation permease subunit
MTPFRTLLRVERARILRRPMAWILGVIVGGMTGLIYFSLALTLLLPEDLESGLSPEETQEIRELVIFPDGFAFGMSAIGGFATIAMIILAAGVFGSEFSWGTVRTSLMAGISRDRFYAAKMTALLALAGLVALVSAVLSFGLTLATGVVVDQSFYIDEWLTGEFFLDLLLVIVRTFIAIGIWTLIGATITLVTHSLAAGVGVTLGAYIGGDIVLSLLGAAGDLGRWAARLFPNEAVNALLSMNSADPPSYVATDYLWISANLLCYSAAAVAIAVLRFRRMDVIAASG